MDQKLVDLARAVAEIYQASTDLPSIKERMVPFIKKLYEDFESEAQEYYGRREDYNVQLLSKTKSMMEFFEGYFKDKIDAEFVMTSSLNAGINLMGDSDVDISMLIASCDIITIRSITGYLNELGFVFSSIVNPKQPANCYHLFNQKLDSVEFEIKVRSKTNSCAVLALHRYMEERLTIEERIAITYGKFIFKKQQQDSYAIFKKLVFERYFAEIDGGFMLDLH